MSIEHLLAFNIALLAAIASPGPALLVAMRATLSAGRSAGVATGLGLAVMAALWTLLALLGLESVFHLFPRAYTLAKGAGALYLLFIAWQMWRGARSTLEVDEQPATRAFRRGFLINLLNPKSVLFAAAVLVVVFPEGMNAYDNAIVVANHLVVELLFYTMLAFGMSTRAVSTGYLRARLWTDRVAAAILGALGLHLLLQRDDAWWGDWEPR